MAKFLKFLLALAVATAVEFLGLELYSGFARVVDPFLILALWIALDGRPVAAMLAGSASGLVADALSGGSFGLLGFANTGAAFVAARLRQRLVVQHPAQMALLFMAGAAVQAGLTALAARLLVAGSELPSLFEVVATIVTSAVGGLLLVALTRRARRLLASWRDARNRKLKIAR